MPPQPNDLALLGCGLLNVAVFGSAWRFTARRVTTSIGQSLFDAALLGYAIQYVAVGLPGALGLLRFPVTAAVALVASAALVVAAGRKPATPTGGTPPAARAAVVALGTFAAVIALGFAAFQSDLPVMANDALTYHFPAAAQWVQRGRIEPFPTWFFNPANGYSPLAGSTFIAWLMLPFGSDALARFVQVPALLCVGLGVYRLGREQLAAPAVAAAVAVAAVLCRPLFMAELMGKDDLFVAFAFIAALVALSPSRAADGFAAARLGLAVGLLLAMKYTVLLVLPVLLVSIDGPIKAGWRSTRWLSASAIAVVLAGPWYLRNWLSTGNPLFPLDVSIAGRHLFHGLFTVARSTALASPMADRQIVLGGSYGVPIGVGCLALAAWAAAALIDGRRWIRNPLQRACVVGPLVTLALFFWRSPFPEVRFILPAVLLILAAAVRANRFAFALPVASVATLSVSGGWVFFGPLLAIAAAIAVTVASVDRLVRTGPTYRRWLAVAVPIAAVAAYAYVHWGAATSSYTSAWAADGGGWSMSYRDDQQLWKAVARLVPPDASVAYTNAYLVYPIQGPTLHRRIAYAPARRGVRTPADLPWLGDNLPGESLVAAANRATVADPDLPTWRENLRRIGAQYLVIGHALPGNDAAELDWARREPRRFRSLYDGPGGQVFAIVAPD